MLNIGTARERGQIIQPARSLLAPLCGAVHRQAHCAATPRAQERPQRRHAAKQRDEDNGSRPGAESGEGGCLLVAPLRGATHLQALRAEIPGAQERPQMCHAAKQRDGKSME